MNEKVKEEREIGVNDENFSVRLIYKVLSFFKLKLNKNTKLLLN